MSHLSECAQVALVDDEKEWLDEIGKYLKSASEPGFSVDLRYLENSEDLRWFCDDAHKYELVILDIFFNDEKERGKDLRLEGVPADGFKVIRHLGKRDVSFPFVLLTQGYTPERHEEGLKVGALNVWSKFDFQLDPPEHGFHKLTQSILGVLRSVRLAKRASPTLVPGVAVPGPGDFVGKGIRRALHVPLAECRVDAKPALILGERGTGKYLAADLIHRRSRPGQPFHRINLAAIPDYAVETELFGTSAGMYTNVGQKPGAFHQAHGGTLFLDEIGEMRLELQAKLLGVLETPVRNPPSETRFPVAVAPMGTGGRAQELDVRIVCATNLSEEKLRDPSVFRQDLLSRMTHLVRMPVLRENTADVEDLANHFLRLRNAIGKTRITLDPDIIPRLMRHSWPDNIRELDGAISRGYARVRVLDKSVIEYEDLQLYDPIPRSGRFSVASNAGDVERLLNSELRRVLGCMVHEAAAAPNRIQNTIDAARAAGLNAPKQVYTSSTYTPGFEGQFREEFKRYQLRKSPYDLWLEFLRKRGITI